MFQLRWVSRVVADCLDCLDLTGRYIEPIYGSSAERQYVIFSTSIQSPMFLTEHVKWSRNTCWTYQECRVESGEINIRSGDGYSLIDQCQVSSERTGPNSGRDGWQHRMDDTVPNDYFIQTIDTDLPTAIIPPRRQPRI